MFHIESPRTDDQAVEQMIQAKGKTAPRVTPADIEANIASEYYFTAEHGTVGSADHVHPDDRVPLSLLTFCVLVLQNGYTVTGESACASPVNFDSKIGRVVARKNAVEKIWPLMGYELKCRLAAEPADFRDRVRAECADLNGKIERLSSFTSLAKFMDLPAMERDRLLAQLSAMIDYANVLRERIAAFDQEATA